MKFFCYILFSLTLIGCAVGSKPISEEALNRIDKVALVSAVNSEFCYSYIGITAFNNYLKCEPVTDYPMEKRLLEEALRQVKKKTSIPISVIELDSISKEKINKAQDRFGNLIGKDASLALGDFKHRYVVVLRADRFQFNEIQHPIQGFGIWGQRTKNGFPYLIYKLELIDIQTKEILAVGSTAYRDSGISLPWMEPYTAYGETELNKIWHIFEKALPESFEFAVYPLFYRK